jgi:hypothetical protein
MRYAMITRMLTFLLLTISMYAAAQVTRVEPQPSTHRQDSLISVATGLHDDGNYDDAIAMYRRVLEENSSNVTALYEISYS